MPPEAGGAAPGWRHGGRIFIGRRLAHWGRGWILSIAPGWWVVWGALAVTTALWAIGQAEMTQGPRLWPWMGPGLLLGDWAITLFSVILLATARSRMIEPVFGGLDRAVRLHRRLGPTAVALVLVHVALYVPPALAPGHSLGDLLVPFWSPSAASFNSVVLYLLLIWTWFAYTKWFNYEGWLSLHGLLGLIFLGTAAHALKDGPTVRAFEPLRFWMWLLVLIGFASWFYRVVLYRWVAPRYHYTVEAVQQRLDSTIDLLLRPQERRMMYEPGTFVFINRPRHKTMQRELHPFSISSSPTERFLRLSIRMLGDFTRALPGLEAGEPIGVFGPFGGFTPHRHARYHRLACIGAGIGITPFLAMLRFEMANDDFRRIWLWYVVHDAAAAPYDAEIRDTVEKAVSYIDYELWATGERGRLTAAQVAEAIRPLEDYAVMLCGSPAFVADMVRQFIALGLPRERLIAEDFFFR